METRNCLICGSEYTQGREYTCSDKCHLKLANKIVEEFGEYKKVVRAGTGEVFKVPTIDIIEYGLKEKDLDKYPKWEDDKEN
jgi:hypothetical protein